MDAAARGGWLGFDPASEAAVEAAEHRLGSRLPPSLREFLLVTDGWKNAGNFVHQLAGTAELAWLRDTEEAHWIKAYAGLAGEDPDGGDEPGYPVLKRSLRLSTSADSAVVVLDPGDVGPDGEWAAYFLASWTGTGPERHGSFADLMQHLYARFHALRRPPGRTRDRWEEQVEQARRAALAGEVDGPAAVFERAQQFGVDRARLLRFQQRAMQGDWYTVQLAHLVAAAGPGVDLTQDPFFVAELLPLLFVEERLSHTRRRFTLGWLDQRSHPRTRQAVAEYGHQLEDPAFRPPLGNPEFDRAVRAVLDRLPDTHIRQQRDPHWQARLDAAWPELRAAIALWRPVDDNHIAPVVLFAEPILAQIITPERGREILATPRG
ncbi:MAG TPA: SMI1/KNR4 family protein [Micromonosporaceae bacterium]|nr:SMI1/KNR4 family protein [Micromonosporaceae bacterium]